jgi:hypothetical protein
VVEAEARWTLTEGTRLGVAATLLSVRAGDEPGLESKYALRPRTEEVTVGLRQVVPGDVSPSALVTHARQGGPGATYRSATREVDLRLEAPVPGGPLHGPGSTWTSGTSPMPITRTSRGKPVAGTGRLPGAPGVRGKGRGLKAPGGAASHQPR